MPARIQPVLHMITGGSAAMEWQTFAEWALQGILAGGVTYAAWVLGKLNNSIQTLNQQMAVILERDQWHTKWLERHDLEIKELERKALK
jgi:hypothetical protein